MKKLIAFSLALVMLFALVSCGSKSIVGKWAFGVNTYEFKSDNTVSVSLNGVMNYDGTYSVSGDKVTVTVNTLAGEQTSELTYKLSGKTLTLTGDVTFSGSTVTLEFTKA